MKLFHCINQTVLDIFILKLSEYQMMVSLYTGIKNESILSQMIGASFQILDTEVIKTESSWVFRSLVAFRSGLYLQAPCGPALPHTYVSLSFFWLCSWIHQLALLQFEVSLPCHFRTWHFLDAPSSRIRSGLGFITPIHWLGDCPSGLICDRR